MSVDSTRQLRCETCGAEVPYRRPKYQWGKHVFCSHKCSANRPRPPFQEAFWAKVQKTEGCWIWTRGRDDYGYGNVRREGKNEHAHRISWELTNGPIPNGLCVLHRCDNPPCVRPDHLFLGTKKDNVADMLAKGRTRPNPPSGQKWRDAHRYSVLSGENHPRSRLTWDQVHAIKDLLRTRPALTQREIAARCGVKRESVSQIKSGRIWREP